MATIRINDKDKKKLDLICREAELSQPEVLHLAITALEKQRMSKKLKSDFEALAFDSSAMENYKKDSQKLDQASYDGLLD